MIHTGDCIEVMAGMPADSVDAVVTDPPAGIAFMSKHWDRDKGGRTEWVAWMTEVMRECYRVLKPGGYAVVWSLPRTCHWTAWAMEDAGFIIRDQLAHIFASGFPKGKAQLKPAREDWWLARKPGPLRPLNIEETRIGTDTIEVGISLAHRGGKYGAGEGGRGTSETTQHVGRWPSNLLLSDPELFDEPNPYVVGSGATSDSGEPHQVRRRATSLYEGGWASTDEGFAMGGAGGYSRFFIVPKSSRSDREPIITPDGHDRSKRFSTHPTQKPTDLMAHLIRLVCPPDGVILDPFLGSGSTAIAAEREGVKWIGIEKEESYVAIAEARLNGTQRGLGLDVGAPTRTGEARSSGHYNKGARGIGAKEGAASIPIDGLTSASYDDGPRRPKPDKPKADNAALFDEEPAA